MSGWISTLTLKRVGWTPWTVTSQFIHYSTSDQNCLQQRSSRCIKRPNSAEVHVSPVWTETHQTNYNGLRTKCWLTWSTKNFFNPSTSLISKINWIRLSWEKLEKTFKVQHIEVPHHPTNSIRLRLNFSFPLWDSLMTVLYWSRKKLY